MILDDVAVGGAAGNGGIYIRSGSNLAPITSNFGFGGPVKLGVQSDNSLIVGVGSPADAFGKRDPNTLAPVAGSGGGGIGQPFSTLAVLRNDNVYIGTANGASQQTRNPMLTGIIGGPAGVGSGVTASSGMRNSDEVLILYNSGGQGRIRRDAASPLFLVGVDESVAGSATYGVDVATQSDDTIVLARSDRVVELRNRVTLSSDLGGFARSAGPFGSDIAGIGVLSDNSVVVAMVSGEIQVRSADLQSVLYGNGGFGDITALAVQHDDDIVVGTGSGDLRLLSPSLVTKFTESGLGPITDVAVFVPEPASLWLLCAAGAVLARRRGNRPLQ
ncbi:MAG: PEP-CTERM sorting domain-containing protein [Planctomycetes bacterium]|nr:PEP-CTERM sorting domain-containing protein [Planctomycetota bacterium]